MHMMYVIYLRWRQFRKLIVAAECSANNGVSFAPSGGMLNSFEHAQLYLCAADSFVPCHHLLPHGQTTMGRAGGIKSNSRIP